MRRSMVVALALTLALSAVVLAGANPDTKVAIHIRGHNAKAGCSTGLPMLDCHDMITSVGYPSVDAFPVFFDLVEFLGCEYGVCWPDWAYSAEFRNCSDLVIGTITWSGDGASHTWTACQTGLVIPSVLWLYADGPGMICPCPHPVSGVINVLDCAEGLDDPMCVFCAGAYGMLGDDPCGPTGSEPRTWGEIKGLFE